MTKSQLPPRQLSLEERLSIYFSILNDLKDRNYSKPKNLCRLLHIEVKRRYGWYETLDLFPELEIAKNHFNCGGRGFWWDEHDISFRIEFVEWMMSKAYEGLQTYRAEHKVNIALNRDKDIDLDIKRSIIITLLDSLPEEKLNSLFNMRVIDPYSKESEMKILKKIPCSSQERAELISLRESGDPIKRVVRYRVEITL